MAEPVDRIVARIAAVVRRILINRPRLHGSIEFHFKDGRPASYDERAKGRFEDRKDAIKH